MKITEHNVTTGEVIEREMTADEIAQRETDEVQSQQSAADQAAKAAARQAVLDKLGLSADEVAALLG
jgi:hypothetical protein